MTGAQSSSAAGGTAQPPRGDVDDKLVWTLIRPAGSGFKEFQDYVLHELAAAAGALVADMSSVWVSLQDQHVFSGAIVNVKGENQRVDAIVQITSSASYVATDPVNSVLAAESGHVQGWRMHQTVMMDASEPAPLLTPMPFVSSLWLNQRIDGTTKEAYDRNWYIHGGHLDGGEEDSEEARRFRAERMAAAGVSAPSGRWYIQNRTVEPITPTAWVVHGMSDYPVLEYIPGPGERFVPQNPGEESFDKWPPRLFQGRTYRVA